MTGEESDTYRDLVPLETAHLCCNLLINPLMLSRRANAVKRTHS
jgi:hypothetical protein